jgi:mono/diheme cytochrome c family protein
MLTTVSILPSGLLLFGARPSLACSPASYEASAQYPPDQDPPGMDPSGLLPSEDEMLGNRTRSKGARKKGRPADKSKKTSPDGKAKSAADDGRLKFSQDIAPILVANCVGCHSGDGNGVRRGKLDLTTFEKLQTGTPDHKVVTAGKPAESSLVLRIKGEETPRMPQGNNRTLADVAIAKIERWVKEGAKLDQGLDPKKPMASYAASPDQVRRAQTAKLPVEERDKAVVAAGRDRFKKANAKLNPDAIPSEHFMLFSNLPRDRYTNTLKVLETQHGHLKWFLGAAATNWSEKVGIYVFANRKDFIEFVRSIENRELEPDDFSTANLTIAQPYAAVVDPMGGQREEGGATTKRRPRSRRSEDGAAGGIGSDRTLNGLITDAVGSAAVRSAGSAPRWLASGIGSYLASKVEPSSPHYNHLRQNAFANWQQGWATKANEAMGGSDQITVDSLHAISFALVEAMMAEMRQGFPAFVSGMLQGGEKLDDVLLKVYHGSREDLINGTSDWIGARYGNLQ